MLQIKSYPNDSTSEGSESGQMTGRKFGSNRMEETFFEDNQASELFKEVQRKMQGGKESAKMFKRKEECFFVNLKKRLQK